MPFNIISSFTLVVTVSTVINHIVLTTSSLPSELLERVCYSYQYSTGTEFFQQKHCLYQVGEGWAHRPVRGPIQTQAAPDKEMIPLDSNDLGTLIKTNVFIK